MGSRHVRRGVLLLLGVLGVLAVVALLSADPTAVLLLADAEFLAVSAGVGLALLGADLRVVRSWLLATTPAVWCRAGLALTRTAPRNLLAG